MSDYDIPRLKWSAGGMLKDDKGGYVFYVDYQNLELAHKQALRQIEAQSRQQWQPISSLPLDDIQKKNELLFAYDDGCVCSMGADEAAGIVVGETKGIYVGKLTHWMQLPEPPTQNEEQL